MDYIKIEQKKLLKFCVIDITILIKILVENIPTSNKTRRKVIQSDRLMHIYLCLPICRIASSIKMT